MINLEAHSFHILKLTCVLLLLVYPDIVHSECTCDVEDIKTDKGEAIKYKLGSIASILLCGGIGVGLPLLGKKIPTLRPENDIFFMIKAFAAGVILATAFIHILPEAFDHLASPCLNKNPWGNFPFAGFVAMVSAIMTLMVDSLATGFYKRQHFGKNKEVISPDIADDEEIRVSDDHSDHLHVHTHGHAHGSAPSPSQDFSISQLIRHRIVSQVLEVGIVVHSVIIGISLGASQSSETIKPLLIALSFHQFFEGMGLGGCISQAQFKSKSTAIMAIFFSLTSPIGIAIGIAISRVYKENSSTALIVEGIFNSASAGILIYMALVDLLAVDFMSPRLQNNFRIQLGANVSLLLGAGCMSVLALWA